MNKEKIYRNVKLALACLDENKREFYFYENSVVLLTEYTETYDKLYRLCRLLHREWEIEE